MLWVPRQDVDHAPLAEEREGSFGDHLPAERAEACDNNVLESGVLSVEHPKAVVVGCSEADVKPRAACFRESPEVGDLNATDPAGLDVDDHIARDVSSPRQVSLAPALADPERAEDCAGLAVVHRGSMAIAAHLAITAEARGRARVAEEA